MIPSSEKSYYNAAVLTFDGADILDFAGPMEVLSHALHNANPDDPDPAYKVSLVAAKSEIVAARSLTVKADLMIDDLLAGGAMNLDDFDLLVVPGGPPSVIKPLLSNESPETRLIKAFASLSPKEGSGPRMLFSVCTGAFFLGALGLLTEITVTTHHRALGVLSTICGSNQPSEIVEKRCVDGGLCKSSLSQPGGIRIVTAGGISSGLDASIWIVSQQVGIDIARFIGRVMEYNIGVELDA
jgi:transcriptional regulator GlxA family with amidase domain